MGCNRHPEKSQKKVNSNIGPKRLYGPSGHLSLIDHNGAINSLSDQDLIRAFNAGDARAFETLYHRHKAFVSRIAFRFCGNDEDAMDVLQETFAYFLGKFPGFVLTSSMTTFLYPAARNIAIALKRKRRRYIGGDDESLLEFLPAPMTASGDLEDLHDVIATLPRVYRETVLLRFVDDLSLEEIALALQVPLGTVKSRLSEAIAQLRRNPKVARYFAM